MLLGVLWLIEEEVGCELLVLVTCEVGLDDKISFETKTAELLSWLADEEKYRRKATHSFDGFSLLFSNADGLGTGGQSGIVVNILSEKRHEGFGILADELCDLGVTSSNLLKDGLQHLRLSLNELAKLLELGVVSKELQRITTCTKSSFSTLSGLSCAGGSTTTALTSLSCGLEQIDTLCFTTSRLRSSGG